MFMARTFNELAVGSEPPDSHQHWTSGSDQRKPEARRTANGLQLRWLLTFLLSRDQFNGDEPSCQLVPKPTATDGGGIADATIGRWQQVPNRQQPTEVRKQASAKLTATGAVASVTPTQRWARAPEHAATLLVYLQSPGGRTGTIPVHELKQIYLEFCFECDLEPLGWTAVGRELRKLLGAPKDYERINGEQVRVYRIPPQQAQARMRAA